MYSLYCIKDSFTRTTSRYLVTVYYCATPLIQYYIKLAKGTDSTFYTRLELCRLFYQKGRYFSHCLILEGVGFFCNFCGQLCAGGDKTKTLTTL